MDQTNLEDQIEALASILHNRVMKGKNTVIFKELLDEPIPQFLKNYLKNRVQKIYNTEEPVQISQSKRYDLNYHLIEELNSKLKKAFEEATLFTKEEMKDIICRTINLQFDLLTSPAETLQKIFFHNKTELTQTEVLRILEALEDNRIFIKKLIDNIRLYDQYHIISDDFSQITQLTLAECYGGNFHGPLISDFESFIDFLNHIDVGSTNAIHKTIIKLMLEKRNLEHLYDLLIKIDDTQGKYELSMLTSRLSEILNDDIRNVHSGRSRRSASEKKSDFLLSSYRVRRDHRASPTKSTETAGQGPHRLDENDHLAEINHSIIEGCKEPQDVIIDRSMIEQKPDDPLTSLHTLIDDKSRRMIQKKIFSRDNEAFNKFLDRLETIDNWKEAKQIIDSELMIRSIQPFSREALRLGDLVFNRYFPKKEID